MSGPTFRFDLRAFAILILGLTVAYGIAFRLLDRRYALTSVFRSVLSRFAPWFLIVAPPIITYGFLCGALSFGFAELCDTFFIPKIADRDTFYRPIFKAFEYVCGIAGGYVWIRFAMWSELRWPWYLFILASHALVAGYREARFDFGGIGMGPTVSEHFILLDALFPFLALLPYYLFHARKNALRRE